MHINLKPDPAKGHKVMELFKVDASLIQKAKAKDIVCVSTTPGIWTIRSKTKVFGNIAVKPTALSLVEQKALAPSSLEQYRFSFESALKKAIEATPDHEAAKNMLPGMPPASIAGVVDGLASETSIAEAIKQVQQAKAMPFPLDEALKVKKKSLPKAVPSTLPGAPALKDATTLYQAVKGTNSIYHTFAFFPGLKLAARINGTKLSVRAEGEWLGSYLPILKNQFKMDYGKGYASAHYIADEGKDLIVKTLAAIVGVLGYQKVEKVADLNQFVFDQMV